MPTPAKGSVSTHGEGGPRCPGGIPRPLMAGARTQAFGATSPWTLQSCLLPERAAAGEPGLLEPLSCQAGVGGPGI